MSNQTALEAWLACKEEEQAGVLATVLQSETSLNTVNSIQMFISSKNIPIGNLGDTKINAQLLNIAISKLSEKKPKSEILPFQLSNKKEVSILIDVYIPPAELVIFGAGHEAIPIANYSTSLGLRTTIVDAREFYNSKKNFPNTKRIIVKEEDFLEKIKIGKQTYIIVMNDNLEKNLSTLKFVLNSSAPYIGVLGTQSRQFRILDALKNDGFIFSERQLSRLYSPVGLDIGAESAEEIAISILAEVIAVKNGHGHSGGLLQGTEFIHPNIHVKRTVES